ncbi:MAG: phosphoribulokinase [Clostridia bacterium]|nr:phosphoribulokinase [Clostridia bacterium]
MDDKSPFATVDDFQPVFDRIEGAMRQSSRVLMAIDGMCAAGKSELARRIADRYACNVFHMDDFFLTPEMRTPARLATPGGNVDVDRFMAEVLEPILASRTSCYRRYDCRTGAFAVRRIPPPQRLEIVEGAYSLHPKLRRAYGLAVGLRVSPDVQLRRISAREGEERLPDFLARWIPMENMYLNETRVWASCDLVVDTTGLY